LKQFYTRQIGRAEGRDIVQEGDAGTGETMRWSFTGQPPASPDGTRTADNLNESREMVCADAVPSHAPNQSALGAYASLPRPHDAAL
jgi:hypothetical protein